MRVCIVGASGKLGQYMIQQSLDRGDEVVGVCREQSVGKLDAFKGRITVIPGATDDREVVKRAVAGCDGVLVVMTPRGVHGYSTGTTQAVLDYAPPGARSRRPPDPLGARVRRLTSAPSDARVCSHLTPNSFSGRAPSAPRPGLSDAATPFFVGTTRFIVTQEYRCRQRSSTWNR